MTDESRIPILLFKGVLVVSIQVDLSDEVVRQLRHDATLEIERTQARAVVIDLTGVDLMDSHISRAIRDLAMVASLMGAETAICGLNPLVAVTLVEMGMGMESVKSFLALEDAIDALAVRGDGTGSDVVEVVLEFEQAEHGLR